MTIYLVRCTEYDDYATYGVYSSQEGADARVSELAEKGPKWCANSYEVTEFELDHPEER